MAQENTRVVIVEKMTKVSFADQTKLINYFSRCPLLIRLAIFEQQRDIFHRLRGDHSRVEASLSDIAYAALILSIGLIRTKEKSLLSKSFNDHSMDEIRDLSSFQVKKFIGKTEKRAEKREKLIGYWSLVRDLKINHGLSYEKISQFLHKKRKFKISASYIYECWHELETPTTASSEEVK